MRRITPIYYIIVIVILISVIMTLYRDNVKIKTLQGGLAENKIEWLQIQLKFTSEYLSSTKTPEKEYIDRSSEKFSEASILLNGIMSSSMPSTYLSMIRIDLDRMSANIKNKKSEKEFIKIKQSLIDKITILRNELEYIRKSCKNNEIKYYHLSLYNTPMMKKVDKDMLDYLNKNNIH